MRLEVRRNRYSLFTIHYSPFTIHPMYCPQCGTESSSGLQYCRSCGANLKVIGKALTLSEAIARSDRGPLPKIKEMFKNLHIERVTEDVSRALDRMNKEILSSSTTTAPPIPSMDKRGSKSRRRKEKTAEERRENQIAKGTVSLFSGIGLTIFLYYLSAVLVLKLPPDVIAKIPFELEPVVRVIWLFGLVPVLSGVGHIVAGLMIRQSHHEKLSGETARLDSIDTTADESRLAEPVKAEEASPQRAPVSVTERTTNLLNRPE